MGPPGKSDFPNVCAINSGNARHDILDGELRHLLATAANSRPGKALISQNSLRMSFLRTISIWSSAVSFAAKATQGSNCANSTNSSLKLGADQQPQEFFNILLRVDTSLNDAEPVCSGTSPALRKQGFSDKLAASRLSLSSQVPCPLAALLPRLFNAASL